MADGSSFLLGMLKMLKKDIEKRKIAENEKLTKEFVFHRQKECELKQENADLTDQLKLLAEQEEVALKQHEYLVNEVSATMTRYNQFVDEINGYEVYRATVAGRIAEENAENEEWFEAYDNEIDKLQNEVKKFEESNKESLEQNRLLLVKGAKMQRDMKNIEAQRQAEQTTLLARLGFVEKSIESHKLDEAILTKELAQKTVEYEKEMATWQQQIGEADKQAAIMQQQLVDGERESDSLNEKLRELNVDKQYFEQSITGIQADINSYIKECDELTAKRELNRQAICEMDKKLANSLVMRNTTSNENEQKANEIMELEEKLKQLETELKALTETTSKSGSGILQQFLNAIPIPAKNEENPLRSKKQVLSQPMSAISVVMKQASRPAPSQSTIKNLPDDKKQTKVKFVKSDLNSPLPKRNKMAATRKPTNTAVKGAAVSDDDDDNDAEVTKITDCTFDQMKKL